MEKPKFFTLIGVVLLLWNLAGVAAFVAQFTADPADLAKTDPTTAKAFATMPGWVWFAYGHAVGAGAIGAVLLLARKAAAAGAFLMSLIFVLVQFGHTFLGTDLLAVKGVGAAILPAIIISVAIWQLLYARNLVAKRVLR